MAIQKIYSNFTHASCKKMHACAIEALAKKLQNDDAESNEVVCSTREVELLREVIETMGTKDIIDQIN